jgi:hypothetical protein
MVLSQNSAQHAFSKEDVYHLNIVLLEEKCYLMNSTLLKYEVISLSTK